MAESKTARKSRGDVKKELGKVCFGCGEPMMATQVIKSAGASGGMFWICQKCGHRERVTKR